MAPAGSPEVYFAASGCAAIVNYPLWKASAIAQSGFDARIGVSGRARALLAPLAPPYKGLIPVVSGMTWARAAIFYGSDRGAAALRAAGVRDPLLTTLAPPLVVATLVQLVNQPLVRASVMIQDPASPHTGVPAAMRAVYRSTGLAGLWHGTSAGVFKTVPKHVHQRRLRSRGGWKLSPPPRRLSRCRYCTAVAVKEFMEHQLPRPRAGGSRERSEALARSAVKSCTAALAGAVLTNPLDVIRNEMFKTDLPLGAAVRRLHAAHGGSPRWLARGLAKNVVAVAVPVACTIFLTDTFDRWMKEHAAELAR